MNKSKESYQSNLISTVKKKHIFIGILVFMMIPLIKVFNSSNTKIPSLPITVTKHTNKSLQTTSQLISTTTKTTIFSTIATPKLTPTTTKMSSSSSTTTTINYDEILCDNVTEFKSVNVLQNPCERIRCAVILRSSGGRLGNRMFMFASAYGLARAHHCRLHVSESILQELSQYFQMKAIDKTVWLSTEELRHLKDIQNKDTVCSFLPELFRPNAFKNIELTGYWQSYLYFDAYREEIRELFTARKDTLLRVAAYFTNITNSICPLCFPLPNTTHQELRHTFQTRYNITWISIHIRRNDFRQLGYSSDNDYLHRAISFYRRRYYQSQIRFLVASDDRSYCRDLFASERKSGKLFVLPDHFSPADDLIALSLCHHSIVTGGTFGFWSAYLTGGEVIHDVRYRTGCLRSDYYPPWFILVGPVVENKV